MKRSARLAFRYQLRKGAGGEKCIGGDLTMAPPPRNSRASAPAEAQAAPKAINTRRVLNICADAWADIVAARRVRSDSMVIFIVAWKEGEGGIGYDGDLMPNRIEVVW